MPDRDTNLAPGAERIETAQVVHHDNLGKTYLALYLYPNGDMAVLVDQLKEGDWSSTFLPTNVTDSLRKLLNRGLVEALRRSRE